MKRTDYDHYMYLISEGKLDDATEFRRKIMPQYYISFIHYTQRQGEGK